MTKNKVIKHSPGLISVCAEEYESKSKQKPMKYAFTYEIQRHVNAFVGPFDSYNRMIEGIISLVEDDESGVDQVIEDCLFVDHEIEYLQRRLNLRIYEVSEQIFNPNDFIDVCDKWRAEIDKINKRYKLQYEKNERQEYERLRKKFEGNK